MVGIALDFRSSWRAIRRHSRIAALAAITISLSIGIVVAAFSVIEAELIRPLPYNDPKQIVILQGRSATGQPMAESYLHYLDLQRETKSLSAIAGLTTGAGNVQIGSESKRLKTVYVTDTFFNVFGVAPFLGRTFSIGENQPGRSDVVVLSFEVWQQEFGSSKAAIGKPITIDGKPLVVIGVMPQNFRYPLGVRGAAYLPLSIELKAQARGSHWLRILARLKSGVSVQQAQTDLDRICQELGKIYPATDAGFTLQPINLKEWSTRDTAAPLKILSLAAVAVFLIGCFNAAGLITVRNTKRTHELSVRAALGASRQQIMRLVLSDSLMLCSFGLLGGLLVSWLLLTLMTPFLLNSLSRGADVHLTLPSGVFALITTLCTSLLVGMVPAMRLAKTDPNYALKEEVGVAGGRGQQRIRALVVINQAAIAFVLLVLAGISVRTIWRWRNAQVGFSTANTVTLEINVAPAAYKDRDIIADFYQPLLDRVGNVPGVQEAGLIQVLPIDDWGWSSGVHIAGRPHDPPSGQRMAEDRYVSPGYFRALGIAVTRGRMLDPKTDTRTSQPVCLVNEAFAHSIFGNANPLGQTIDEGGGPPCSIVGVTNSIRQDLFAEPLAEEDYPISQFPREMANQAFTTMHLVIRTVRAPSALTPELRAIMHDLDPSVPLETLQTMDDVLSKVIVLQRMEGWLLGVFAGLALFLAATGLYGLVSYEVQISVRSIGLRMAMGATRLSILNRVLRRVGSLLVIGIGVGSVCLFVLQRLFARVIALDVPHDLAPMVELAGFLLLVGLSSAFLPALRAAFIQPMDALRNP